MVKSKVPLILRAAFTSTAAEQAAGEQLTIDLSAYVDALAGKVLKIRNVWFGIDDGSGESVPISDYEADAPNGIMQLTTGTQSSIKAMSDDRVIAQMSYYYQAVDVNGASSPPQVVWSLPVADMGYFVAADTLTFQTAPQDQAFDSDTRYLVVFEAERVKLTAADVNFLLVNQTTSRL
jgi:hypothetical protein